MDKQERLKKFMNDERTSKYVFDEIRDTFLKSRGTKDVHTLAGERIAIELLDKAFERMTALKSKEDEDTLSYKQVGL